MTDKQKIHEIALASLPILYQQLKDMGADPSTFDIVAEYKRITHAFEDDKTLE